MGPEKTIDGSGLDANDLHGTTPEDMWLSGPDGPHWIQYEFDRIYKLYEMWVWNSNQEAEPDFGLGAQDVTIDVSTDGETWTTLEALALSQAPGAEGYAHNITVDFKGSAAKYVKINIANNYSILDFVTQAGLSEVCFFYLPVRARKPQPADGAVDVDPAVMLGWRAGRYAVSHQVILDSTMSAVVDGSALLDTVTDSHYDLAGLGLLLDETYYWKIDEVSEAGTPSVWNFSTKEFIVVDDFESYNDIDPDSNRIFESWPDGFLTPTTNGALIGYDPPQPSYAETVTVHGGDQSMPLFYSNTGGATYSEGTRTFAVPQDWTGHGIQTLVLYFYGTPDNTGQLYVKINGVKILYGGDAGNLAIPVWQLWPIDLASAGIKQDEITSLAIGVDAAAVGVVFIDDICLYRTLPETPVALP